MAVVADPMQAFVVVMGVVIALLSIGGFYSLHRVRQIDREMARREKLAGAPE
jgi:cell division protein FtsB